MAKLKQTSQEAAAIIAADKLQAGEQQAGEGSAVGKGSAGGGELGQDSGTLSGQQGHVTVDDAAFQGDLGNATFAAPRDQLAPPAPVYRERFKALSNILIDGEGAEAGGPIWLTEEQFDHLKPLGAIEGEWPD